MAIGFWADTQKIFRPGVAARMSADTAASTVNSRMLSFFTAQNRAKWLKTGTFVNFDAIFTMRNLYTNQSIAPSSPTDPDDPAYNWTLLDSYNSMEFLDPANCGPGLMLQMFHTAGRTPLWFRNAGYTWFNSDNSEQIRYWMPEAVQALKDLFTAVHNRYSNNYKWWVIGIAEDLSGGTSAWPAGKTNTSTALGVAEILTHIDNLFGGKIWTTIGSLNATTASYMLPLTALHNPDPKLTPLLTEYATGNTGTWPQAFMMRESDNRLCKQGVEPNGLKYVTWRDDVENPFGNTSTAPPPGYHYPTTDELCWAFSSAGICKTHLLVMGSPDWGGVGANGHYLLTLPNWAASFDKYMASGDDSMPYLPASYVISPPADGGGEYTYVGAGSMVSGTGAITVLPPSRSVGDLLLCGTAIWTVTETLNKPSGWDVLAQVGGLALLGRIATDTGTTSASPDAIVSVDMWSGTTNGRAQIAAFSGDVPTSLTDIVVTIEPTNTTTNTANIPTAAVDLVEDNRLVISMGKKNKTISSSITLTAPSGIDNIIGQISGTNSNTLFGWGYTIQTTVTDLTASAWTQDNAESAPSSSLNVVLQAATTVVTIPDVPSGLGADNVTQTSMRITHDDESGADGYRYYKTLDGAGNVVSPPQFIAQQTQAQKTSNGGYPWTGLGSSKTYGFKVSSYNTGGESDLSSEYTQATSTPLDTEDPTYSGLTSVTYNEDEKTFTFTHTQGTDNVTSQANLVYDLYGSTGTISYTTPILTLPAADSFVVPRESLVDGEANTWYFVLRCRDETGNDDSNTTSQSVVVTALPRGVIGPCDNGSGSPKTGDVYLFAAENGVPFSVDITNPSSTGELVTLDEDGEYTFYSEEGIYQWVLIDTTQYESTDDLDDIWMASGWVEVSG